MEQAQNNLDADTKNKLWRQQTRSKRIFNYWFALIFGVIIPVFLLFSAYKVVHDIGPSLQVEEEMHPAKMMDLASQQVHTASDYAFLTWIYGSYANQKSLANKEVLKLAIINIGLAAMSVGLMLIVLGINDGGGEISGNSGVVAGDVKLDIKTGSTGSLIFLAGAIMAATAGIFSNPFNSGDVPKYPVNNINSQNLMLNRDVDFYKACYKNESSASLGCFAAHFRENHREELR